MERRSSWSAQTLTATASDGDITNADSDLYGRRNRRSGRSHLAVVQRRVRNPRPNAQDNTYTLQESDAGKHIRVKVRYQVDGPTQARRAQQADHRLSRAGGPGKGTTSSSSTRQRSPGPSARGTKGRNVGAPVTATGNHGTIRYTLAGTDADQIRDRRGDRPDNNHRSRPELRGTANDATDQCTTLQTRA